jgi:hypothetical protein
LGAFLSRRKVELPMTDTDKQMLEAELRRIDLRRSTIEQLLTTLRLDPPQCWSDGLRHVRRHESMRSCREQEEARG